MDFWVAFTFISLLLFLLECVVPKKHKRLVLFVYLFVIWFVDSFRYMIGVDYAQYERWYNNANIIIDDEVHEPVYKFILFILSSLNFESQMFFLVYSSLTLLFIFKGFEFYLNNDNKKIFVAFLIFEFHNQGYFYSLNIVRQYLAMSMLFWGMKFLVTKEKINYIITLIISSLSHFSASMYIPFLFCGNIIKTKKLKVVISALLFGAALAFLFSGLNWKLFSLTLSMSSGYEERYGMAADFFRPVIVFGVRKFCFLIFYIYIAKFYYNNRRESVNVVLNMAFIYVLLSTLFSIGFPDFPTLDAVPSRFELYFILFYYTLIALFLCDVSDKYKSVIPYVLLVIFAVYFLIDINAYADYASKGIKTSISAGNIDYQFNFNLW